MHKNYNKNLWKITKRDFRYNAQKIQQKFV